MTEKIVFHFTGSGEAKLKDNITITCGYNVDWGENVKNINLTLGDKGGTYVKVGSGYYRDGKKVAIEGRCKAFKDSKLCTDSTSLQVNFLAAPKFSGNITCLIKYVSY